MTSSPLEVEEYGLRRLNTNLTPEKHGNHIDTPGTTIEPFFEQVSSKPEALNRDSSYGSLTSAPKEANHVSRTGKVAEDDEIDDDDAGGLCGWGSFRPNCLQRFRNPWWVLFWVCWAGALQGLIVNGFVNVVITTIERRYGLRSSESGLIAGGYDIASFFCLIPVSYLGGTRSKPLFLGAGVLVLSLGSLLFSVPHFAAGPYAFTKEQEYVCPMNASVEDCQNPHLSPSLNNYKYVFFFGQFLHGAGAAPLYTLGCTFLDENVSTRKSSLFLGIFYTMAIIGPAIGYIVGGQFLKIYTDIEVDVTHLGLTPSSGVWVGAWWIGFIFAGLLGLLIAIPLTAFPRDLPGAKKIRASKVSEMHQKSKESEATQYGFGVGIRDLPASFRILICNPTFVFLSLAGASEGMLVAGLATFLPKVIESQFSMAASFAAIIVGVVTVPGAGGGTFLGGYLVKKFNLKCAAIIKMCIIFSICCLGSAMVFFAHCPDSKLAGKNVPYSNGDFDLKLVIKNSSFGFQAACNSHCSCESDQLDPICGTDNVVYYSPCHAGCQKSHFSEGMKVYDQCSCIPDSGYNMTIGGKVTPVQATREKCDNKCELMPLFLIMIFLSMLFTFLVSMPSLSATLRCVADSQKSFALGIQWITVRLLGTIPAPILFGYLIDRTCLQWQESCGNQGACVLYSNKEMSRYLLALALSLKALSVIFFFFAWLFYKPPNDSKEVNSDVSCNNISENENSLPNSIHSGMKKVGNSVPSISNNIEITSFKLKNGEDTSDLERSRSSLFSSGTDRTSHVYPVV